MPIKNRMRDHLRPVRMAVIKKARSNKYWKGYGEKGTLVPCWWECKLAQPPWKTVWIKPVRGAPGDECMDLK